MVIGVMMQYDVSLYVLHVQFVCYASPPFFMFSLCVMHLPRSWQFLALYIYIEREILEGSTIGGYTV